MSLRACTAPPSYSSLPAKFRSHGFAIDRLKPIELYIGERVRQLFTDLSTDFEPGVAIQGLS
ncbi:hypothetical protein AGABI2DRAFT_148657 [Agaricus bisporus var. bisporus H97]|uniref:hypothetical protein n=1 Tax=Agaricus bisporus var. bisporus (strain H97 / ATCC MYA-4626 / FGSC 10389) TaxID=936046 RepID=UPI00029F5683|nr:hypothetical protein AGABI2DRAFT_148657 [Agaricus bisporus var. bisporus H97]EKV50116.1 hypothetical protein AGABI2DRAFT_148657 [Agaricus bisporus var. bisporus H97]